LDNIQHQYLEFIRQHKDLRVVIVDTSGIDFVQEEASYQVLKNIALGSYAKGVHRLMARDILSNTA
jgi:hypothetical protein